MLVRRSAGTCAGIVRDFFCDRCGIEGLLLGGRLCECCTLADTLSHLLDDGTGRVAPSLKPLVTALLEMDRPKSRLIWLRNPTSSASCGAWPPAPSRSATTGCTRKHPGEPSSTCATC